MNQGQINTNIIVGEYEIMFNKQIGRGSQGSCYLCKQINTQQEYVAKIFVIGQKKAVEKYQQSEIEINNILKSLSSKNLVKVIDIKIDYQKQYQNCYIIMEKCICSLKDLIINNPGKKSFYPIKKILDFISQFLRGYKVLNQNNILHRDLKPENILIGEDGLLKIADFGLGKFVQTPEMQDQQSKVGTPLYCSPQIFENGVYSSKTDVFSLGLIIYELIYGKPLIKATTLYELLSGLQALKNKINLPPINCAGKQEEKEILLFFLDQTLQYDEEQRINWQQLFEYFGDQEEKIESNNQQNKQQQQQNSTKQIQKISITEINKEKNNQHLLSNNDYQQQQVKQTQQQQRQSQQSLYSSHYPVKKLIQNIVQIIQLIMKTRLYLNQVKQQKELQLISILNELEKIDLILIFLQFQFSNFSQELQENKANQLRLFEQLKITQQDIKDYYNNGVNKLQQEQINQYCNTILQELQAIKQILNNNREKNQLWNYLIQQFSNQDQGFQLTDTLKFQKVLKNTLLKLITNSKGRFKETSTIIVSFIVYMIKLINLKVQNQDFLTLQTDDILKIPENNQQMLEYIKVSKIQIDWF